jgi:hypothetical protein
MYVHHSNTESNTLRNIGTHMQTVMAKKQDEHLAERWIDHPLALVLVRPYGGVWLVRGIENLKLS